MSSYQHQHQHSNDPSPLSLPMQSIQNKRNMQNQSSFAQNMAKSMTIEEMRQLHHQALDEAQAKKTELRLVLASRYRELVGSSDEVLRMRERSRELHELVHALPSPMNKLQGNNESIANHSNLAIADTITNTNHTNANVNANANANANHTILEEGNHGPDENSHEKDGKQSTSTTSSMNQLRRDLSRLPRALHRSLDKHDVHRAATTVVQLFSLISAQTNMYPLANALGATLPTTSTTVTNKDDPLVMAQIKVTYLYVERIPEKTVRIAKKILLESASYGNNLQNPHFGAQRSAAALSSLDLLVVVPKEKEIDQQAQYQQFQQQRGLKLIDLYFDSKAKLLHSLLNQLTSNTDTTNNTSNTDTVTNAEDILSKIVLILQYDVILHPYQFFIQRKFPICSNNDCDYDTNSVNITQSIMHSLPQFDSDVVKTKASKFLAAHLPLIRQKVKSVLVTIAGTTASALGKIRQSLYDKTDGLQIMEMLNNTTNGGSTEQQQDAVCTWEEAVSGMVDVRLVLSHGTASFTTDHSASNNNDKTGTTTGTGAGQQLQQSQQRKFSLWSALFSNTFSSLVHSLLTSSFHSVHVKVVSTLRTSLANAPPLSSILPHEAYRNTLRIATELDAALLKVSDDAHELLVHAEERIESERRLRQSLYVQTCEIMGRLLCELRRMLLTTTTTASSSTTVEATKELIVGRLCHLLKFRLTSLPTLLDANSSPAVLHANNSGTQTLSSSGMITLLELQSAFDLADDNDDGLITFEEAMEAGDSAFSGTQFHGAEMVRETLLLAGQRNPGNNKDGPAITSMSGPTFSSSTLVAHHTPTTHSSSQQSPKNVTLEELALLSARGLRHEPIGPKSALGTIQKSLDDIIDHCFQSWAQVVMRSSNEAFGSSLAEFLETASQVSEKEWKRIHSDRVVEENANTMMLEAIEDAIIEEDTSDGIGDTKENGPIIGNVSLYVVGYFLSVSSALNRSVCPSDSLLPVPSEDYAAALGIATTTSTTSTQIHQDYITNMTDTIRSALLQQALQSIAMALDEQLTLAKSTVTEHFDSPDTNSHDDNLIAKDNLKKIGPSARIQLSLDISFLKLCLLERNKYGFTWRHNAQHISNEEGADSSPNAVDRSKMLLERAVSVSKSLLNDGVVAIDEHSLLQSIDRKHRQVLEVCDLVLSSLMGEEALTSNVPSVLGDDITGLGGAGALLLNPLSSSRRFALLPIQSERSLSELQLRSKYRRDKNEEEKQDSDAYGVVSSGLGFFSSMLKKK